MSLAKTLKPKPCKGCLELFQPWSGFQTTCSQTCAIKYSRKKADALLAKQHRAEKSEGRIRLMTRSDWMKRAQAAFNAYIRTRDRNKPCICCGKPLGSDGVGGLFDAGHYRSIGSAPHLRFVEDNCHGQRKQCNRWGAGRAVDYRLGLITRIGLRRVEALESDQIDRKHTIEDLKTIERHYKSRAKEF